MKRVLVVIPVEERHKKYLEEKFPEGEFLYSSIGSVTLSQVKEANVIIGNAPAAMVQECEHLEFMQLNSAGADAYIKEGVIKDETRSHSCEWWARKCNRSGGIEGGTRRRTFIRGST